MRILVTGGAGFIGSHFVKLLAERGDDVVVLDKLTYSGNRANLEGVAHEFHEGDIADAVAVAHAGEGCDAVVNFAAETHVDRSILSGAEFIETDVLGTYVLLRWAREHGARLVQVSTDEVYGDVEAPHRCAEDAQLRPSSPYSASKAGGDMQVLAAVRTYGVDACITRGANTYGSHQYPEKVVPLFVTNALDGLELPVYGDGRQVREWLHAADHAAAVDLVLREGTAGRGLQRRRRRAREPRRHAAHRRADRLRSGARAARRGPSRPRPPLRARRRRSSVRSAGRLRAPSRRASRRRSTGTARTAPGGSRSSRANTARTTRSSTHPG